jgi:pimeloyl-ACP methyl ester carboxylesterase
MPPLSFLPTRSSHAQLPLFIFFPGMDGTGRLFDQQIERLSARFDIRCLAIASDDLTGWSGLTAQAIQLISAELSEGRSLYLCGESFGACLAMQVAGKMGHVVDELVLINPASSFARFPLLAAGGRLSSLLPAMIYPFSARILADFLINPDRVAPPERNSLIEAMLSVKPRTAAWRLDLLKQFRVNAIVTDIRDIPTRLIAGQRDRLLPSVLEVRILQRLLPKSKTILLPGSGHACLLERDLYLADLI